MAGYLLDTNTWIRAFGEIERHSPQIRRLLAESPQLCLASISFWEVAMLTSKKRIDLRMATAKWFEIALPRPRIRVLPLTIDIALEVERLAGRLHGDPADRIIAATANVHQLTLLTADEKLLDLSELRTLDTRQ